MQETLLQQGFDLMTYGMGTVFVFLTLSVVCVYAMSKIINAFFAEPEPVASAPSVSATAASKTLTSHREIDPKIVAAIQEAIFQHRARK